MDWAKNLGLALMYGFGWAGAVWAGADHYYQALVAAAFFFVGACSYELVKIQWKRRHDGRD